MPFLAPLAIPLLTGAAAAGGGALVSKALGGGTPDAPPPVQLGAGLPGGSPNTDWFSFTDALKKAGTPTADPFQGNQLALSNILMQAAQGQGPSVAEQEANVQRGKSLANALALMSSAPGRQNVGLAQRMAMNAGAAGSAAATTAAGNGRIKELFEARNALGNVNAQGTQAANQSQSLQNQQMQAILQMALEREYHAAQLQQGGQNIAYQGAQNAANANKATIGAAFGGIASNIAKSTLPGVAQNTTSPVSSMPGSNASDYTNLP